MLEEGLSGIAASKGRGTPDFGICDNVIIGFPLYKTPSSLLDSELLEPVYWFGGPKN